MLIILCAYRINISYIYVSDHFTNTNDIRYSNGQQLCRTHAIHSNGNLIQHSNQTINLIDIFFCFAFIRSLYGSHVCAVVAFMFSHLNFNLKYLQHDLITNVEIQSFVLESISNAYKLYCFIFMY